MRAVILGYALLAGLFAFPAVAAAAGTCELTTGITPGNVITITGSGFAASTDVDISQTWSGSNATAGGSGGPQTTTSRVTADATGAFDYTIDAGPGHGGTYDVEASDGTCTATTQIAALETAGGVNPGTTNGGTTPPATDEAPFLRGASSPVVPLIPVGAGIALLGIAWAVRRSQRNDAAD